MHYHDGKTQYTSAKGYTDIDGNQRNFDFVDHDKKTKISVPSDGSDPKAELVASKDIMVNKILDIPAVCCPSVFVDFTIRGEKAEVITWNETMLRDKAIPFTQLNDIYTLASNQAKLLRL